MLVKKQKMVRSLTFDHFAISKLNQMLLAENANSGRKISQASLEFRGVTAMN